MINYDVMPNPPVGLKTLEGFLGSNIKETDVDFRINRKLTKEEIEMTVFYCRHDVEETIKVFLEKIDEFNAMHGIIQAFPDIVNLSDIGDSEARITAKVLGCTRRSFEDEFDFYFLPCLQLKNINMFRNGLNRKDRKPCQWTWHTWINTQNVHGTKNKVLKPWLRVFLIHSVLAVFMGQQPHQFTRPGNCCTLM